MHTKRLIRYETSGRGGRRKGEVCLHVGRSSLLEDAYCSTCYCVREFKYSTLSVTIARELSYAVNGGQLLRILVARVSELISTTCIVIVRVVAIHTEDW